ncbi:FAD:protein FMN transferase [Solirubrobacter ginsenosidimutans]|uniref:FAD:protein FMN transferase n=1 Tax=Solirubrobacter ginsenosidimutans TaxID=490573 RepID=A0A9X3S3H6_9ACTN|nr:FAD:protein FMN transferase [Solirubrobacter ginsenosidimutans]MDA0164639.1 FAD:protein FMN transferase [Solirubrobacter ginsenosidimutans]
MTDVSFDCMGTTVRLVTDAADDCRAFLEHFDATLSRFRPGSELCRLNADPREEVPASPLLRAAVSAGLFAAELTNGLVDPTLVSQLEANGYDRTRRTPELPLAQALAKAPPRSPARPDPDERWREITLSDGTVRRPPGLRFDTGGTGKGLAADLLAKRLTGRWAVDCGGDLRVGGAHAVEVRHPLTHQPIHTLEIQDGAVATSGIDTRLWTAEDGTPRHHLLDPSTGTPAWTGLISVTALAPTALEAETLAKAALLSGPRHAQNWLAKHGGLLFTDDGDVHFV